MLAMQIDSSHLQRNINSTQRHVSHEYVAFTLLMQRQTGWATPQPTPQRDRGIVMDILMGGLPLWAFALACVVTLFAGFVKGAIGFALPLIMIAVLPSFMPAPLALAALIMPVLVTNLHQSVRGGLPVALQTARRYWRIIGATVAGIAISAPFVVVLPQQILFLLLGVAVLFFSALQLSGWAPDIPRHWRNSIELCTGLIGGLYGGISGVWGPATIVYLLAAKTEKREMVRVLNVVFSAGAVMLVIVHLRSGVLNAQTFPFSVAMLVPATIGLVFGYRVQDRMDAALFRRYALIMLSVSAVNLLRRGIFG